ncbi:GyrI-like domain-containing protein [Promicromonospora sp. NPDC057488]|uniref:GyrI-like domain-containing protein n=1 Tax=Promicromonospora sp. NPDC057488 TaxID=3346147 RepID=UPI00366F4F37
MADALPRTARLAASDEPELVRSPATRYVAVLGAGAPGNDEFYRRMALAGDVARALAPDAASADRSVVEGQYWYPEDLAPVGIADFYSVHPVTALSYRLMVAVGAGTTPDDVAAARATAASPSDTGADELEVVDLPEQAVVQVMHHGPFSGELATLDRLGRFADQAGVAHSGPHREVYLVAYTSETPQDTLRTILRDPVVA